MKTTPISVFFIFIAVGIISFSMIRGKLFEQNCSGYLMRAADANTVETAKGELQKAIVYLEEHELTRGNTSFFFNSPKNDIGFWYKNLKESERELSKIDSTTSSLEKTNVLMKLRETLIENTEKGDDVTMPERLAQYPNHALWSFLNTISALFLFILIAVYSIKK